MTDNRIEWAAVILRESCGDRLRRDFPLAPLTSFRIGGPAALFLELESEADLRAAGRAISETSVGVVLLGKGSNVLVSDAGFPGLVLRLGRGYRWVAREGTRLSAGGATPLPALAGVALSHGLAGLEFGVAIPASLGGAVRMNAGAHGGSMKDVVGDVELFLLEEGRAATIAAERVGFSYRHSELPERAVVIGASIRLREGDPDDIRAAMDEAREWRRRTQPLAEPNCGSVFKNPEGEHAARLIEAAGGKGLSVGAATVSDKHANFIVAGPGARASDVLELIRRVQGLVESAAGVRLEPEVHVIGDRAAAAD